MMHYTPGFGIGLRNALGYACDQVYPCRSGQLAGRHRSTRLATQLSAPNRCVGFPAIWFGASIVVLLAIARLTDYRLRTLS